jgi:hypothetical protein
VCVAVIQWLKWQMRLCVLEQKGEDAITYRASITNKINRKLKGYTGAFKNNSKNRVMTDINKNNPNVRTDQKA